jgi:hypothetical protein
MELCIDSTITGIATPHTVHGVFIQDAVEFLKALPDSSVQLILIDPPYNLDLDNWDTFSNYLDWAKGWLDEIYYICFWRSFKYVLLVLERTGRGRGLQWWSARARRGQSIRQTIRRGPDATPKELQTMRAAGALLGRLGRRGREGRQGAMVRCLVQLRIANNTLPPSCLRKAFVCP